MRLRITKHLIFCVMVCLLAIFVCMDANATTLASVYFAKQDRKLPIYSVDTDEKIVAISFDAAWGADKTDDIMDVCEKYNVNATFFLVGFWVQDYPETTQRIFNRGFEIGLHSSTHPNMTKLSMKDQELELQQNIDIVYNTTGYSAKLFRPPFGAYDDDLITMCEKLNLTTIQWSVDSLDWKGISGGEIASRVTTRVKNGSIVLFHNNSDNIIIGLTMVLQYLTDNNYKVVPVGELIYESSYKINAQGIQQK